MGKARYGSHWSSHNPEAAGSSPAPRYTARDCPKSMGCTSGAASIILNLQVNSNLLKFKYEQRRKR